MMRIIRRIYAKLLVVVVLMTAIGCRYTPADDPRLMAADSLMEENPDSAYALLSGIVPVGKSNTAYHALLLTQSTIKSYNEITSDSLINISMDYYGKRRYTDEDARRLYVRSRIFKGKVLSLLNRTDDALDIELKTFEYIDSTNPSEYILMGELNHQIAGIYLNNISFDSTYLYRYKQAINYYGKAENNRLVNNDLNVLGAAYSAFNSDSAFKYLKLSLQMSEAMQDSSMIIYNMECLARLYETDNQYAKAKQIALYVYKHGTNYRYDNSIYYDLSKIYCEEKQLDSALYYYQLYEIDTLNTADKYRRLLLQKEIAKLRKDYKSAFDYKCELVTISDSLQTSRLLRDLREIEEKYDYSQIELKQIKLNQKFAITGIILIILIFGLILYLMYLSRERAKQQSFLNRLKAELAYNESEMLHLKNKYSSLSTELSAVNEDATSLRNAIERMGKQAEMSEEDLAFYEYNLRNFIDHYVRNYSELREIKILSDNKKLTEHNILKNIRLKSSEQGQIPSEFWELLQKYTNKKYSELLDRIKSEYPFLSEDEIKIMIMLINDQSRSIISACMNYSERYLNVKLTRMRDKMGLNISVQEYLLSRR